MFSYAGDGGGRDEVGYMGVGGGGEGGEVRVLVTRMISHTAGRGSYAQPTHRVWQTLTSPQRILCDQRVA